ncbi:MAG: hypothetical protein JRG90_05540 [Deltaproteobacteria bacterium]|nr:hypothetical protein [Deltaproteobacteria bacterium]
MSSCCSEPPAATTAWVQTVHTPNQIAVASQIRSESGAGSASVASVAREVNALAPSR